jgi:phosphate transport system substrate-binding protein
VQFGTATPREMSRVCETACRRISFVTIKSPTRLGALAVAAAFVAAACAPAATPTPVPTPTPPVAADPAAPTPPGEIAGFIVVSGSSTVEPIATGVAELFREANPGFDFAIEGPGTGDGFQRFCRGETDISTASRTIRPEGEADLCAQNGIEHIELKIAYDGITVITNPANEAISCLSFADLYALLGPESMGFTRWSDAAPLAAELGSTTTFPDAELTVVGPGEESGTYDSFVELVFGDIAEARGQDEVSRPDYTSSPNDNVIVEGIAGSPTSLGWVGFAFAEENKDRIKEIAVSAEPGGACVAPTPETIADYSYPISRPLFIYVNTARAAANPALAAFVDFFLADGTIAEVLEVVPYVNMPAEELLESRAAWEAR